MRLAYTAEHLSLAIIEYFVHIDAADAPPDLMLVAADIPKSLSRISVPIDRLPSNWRHTPPPSALALIGDDFVASGRAAILIVPSVLAPTDSNWLINPQHPDFGKIRLRKPQPFRYDPRFFAR